MVRQLKSSYHKEYSSFAQDFQWLPLHLPEFCLLHHSRLDLPKEHSWTEEPHIVSHCRKLHIKSECSEIREGGKAFWMQLCMRLMQMVHTIANSPFNCKTDRYPPCTQHQFACFSAGIGIHAQVQSEDR